MAVPPLTTKRECSSSKTIDVSAPTAYIVYDERIAKYLADKLYGQFVEILLCAR